jgi:hypothetical protein
VVGSRRSVVVGGRGRTGRTEPGTASSGWGRDATTELAAAGGGTAPRGRAAASIGSRKKEEDNVWRKKENSKR